MSTRRFWRSGAPRRALAALVCAPLVAAALFSALSAATVFAQTPAAPGTASPNPIPPGAAPPGSKISATCVETIPNGATRPEVTETFPDEGFSGYASSLELTIKHGKGETVLPNGFRVETSSDAFRALDKAGFAIPATDGGSGPSIETHEVGDGSVTKLTIPIVTLPPKPGRVTMTLPSLPVSVARANNEVMTLCTQPHDIVVDEPIANETDPKVKQNPPPRRQKEEWIFLEHLLLGILAGLALGIVAGYFIVKQLRKPKPVYVAPKRKPWAVALEELEGLRGSTLLSEGHKAEFYDKVSDCVRTYLGARYGFDQLGIDGLETTSDEMRALLKRVRPPIKNVEAISEFLADCDLVKFARVAPAEVDCLAAVVKGEGIVRATMPVERPRGQKKRSPHDPREGTPPPPPAPPATPPPPPAAPPPPEVHA